MNILLTQILGTLATQLLAKVDTYGAAKIQELSAEAQTDSNKPGSTVPVRDTLEIVALAGTMNAVHNLLAKWTPAPSPDVSPK